jgi:hypothetical protein
VRWVAESAIAWLHGPRRLRTRWETRDDMHDAFLQPAHCMTLASRTQHSERVPYCSAVRARRPFPRCTR